MEVSDSVERRQQVIIYTSGSAGGCMVDYNVDDGEDGEEKDENADHNADADDNDGDENVGIDDNSDDGNEDGDDWENHYDLDCNSSSSSNVNSSPQDEFLRRDFSKLKLFWSNAVKMADDLPPFLLGDSQFGISDLKQIHATGCKEYVSTDPRHKKKTFALCIMYDGSSYSGYQQQKGVKGVHTVEDDLDDALNRKVVAAGRTDKGVSAISQIVSFATFDDISPTDIISNIKTSRACRSGTLNILDCQRVPRKFNALFSATWRRYIYMFPLQSEDEVDVTFINEALKRLENKALPYNNFAYRENRDCGNGNKDICTLYRTSASVIDISCYVMEREDDQLYNNNAPSTSAEPSSSSSSSSSSFALCIELVGSRFLRRMVRILSATVIRESVREKSVRNINLLEEIALLGTRAQVALPVSGTGLAMAGVGYDLSDLSLLTAGKTGKTGKRKDRENELAGGKSISCVEKNANISGRSRNSKKHKSNSMSSDHTNIAQNEEELPPFRAIKIHKSDCSKCLRALDGYLLHSSSTRRVQDVEEDKDFKYVLLSEEHSTSTPLTPSLLAIVESIQGASIVEIPRR